MSYLTSPAWRADHEVAAAADAWLNDPRDHEAYRRLVAAVLRRRDQAKASGPAVTVRRAGSSVDAEEATIDQAGAPDRDGNIDLTELPDLEPVGSGLVGPTEQVIARLRGLAGPARQVPIPE